MGIPTHPCILHLSPVGESLVDSAQSPTTHPLSGSLEGCEADWLSLMSPGLLCHPLHKGNEPHQWSPPVPILPVPWMTLPDICPLSPSRPLGLEDEGASEEPWDGYQEATWPRLHRASILPPGAASTQGKSPGQVHGGFCPRTPPELNSGKHHLDSPVAGLCQCAPAQHQGGRRQGEDSPTTAMPSLLLFVSGEGEEVTCHQLPPYAFRGWEEPPAGVL